MFAEWLPVTEDSAVSALDTSARSVSWAELQELVAAKIPQYEKWGAERVGLLLAPKIESITSLLALASAQVHTYLMAADTPRSSMTQWAADFELSHVLHPSGQHDALECATASVEKGAITILTSGTTGKPKAAQHSWESLTRPVRRVDPGEHPRWLLTYRPHLYAGLQVILQCLLNEGTLVLPDSDATAEEVVQLGVRSDVEFASATPSYWRWLMTLGGNVSAMPLKQITLGGEAVDQATLDALKRTFPHARLVHIYATTELGRCFSVTDGLAGFPVHFLEQPSRDGVEMRIDLDELVVRSANAMARYDRRESDSPRERWFPTGDLVKVQGDRVHFVGRKSDMINVGGNKVHPLEVEKVIRSVAGVADTRVYAETSSVVGELVKCDVVIQPGFDAAEVERDVRQRTTAEFASFQRPRFVEIVDQIARTAAGKTDRT